MKNLLLLLSLFGFFMFATSCSDDDDCPSEDELEEQAEDLAEEYSDACFFDYDCDDCEDALKDLIDFLESNKNCADDADDVEDYIDDLEDELDDLDC